MKPFLKWAGGKRQLLSRLRPFYPSTFGVYFEPFVGSGAVFFDLVGLGALDRRAARLTDENADLIGCYLRVRDSVDAVLSALARLARGYETGGRDHYLRIRNGRFNPRRAAWRASGADLKAYSPEMAAMLIYLNRTGYNGLFRVNRSGAFNVPPGRYVHPRIVDADGLRAVSSSLAAPGIGVDVAPFEAVLDHAVRGDFVYFDPPYAPLSPTAGFRSYTARGFGDEDQARLQQVTMTLARRGVTVLLSNSSAPIVLELFETNREARAAGLKIYRVPARRAINTRADRRGVVEEVLVTNADNGTGTPLQPGCS